MTSVDMGTARSVKWRFATWSTVFWVPVVAAVLFAVIWLLEQGPYAAMDAYGGERAMALVAAAIAMVVALAVSALLAISTSARRRGLALGLAGSAMVVGLCAVCVAFVLLRWAA